MLQGGDLVNEEGEEPLPSGGSKVCAALMIRKTLPEVLEVAFGGQSESGQGVFLGRE
jgi:hypothetical protein